MPRFSFVPKEGRPALAVAAAALFISLGSVGHAAVTSLITGSQIKDGSVTGVDITNGSLTGTDVKDGSVTGVDITNGSVTGADVKDGYLTGADIKNGSLPGAKITPGSMGLGVFPESSRPAPRSEVYTKAESDTRHPILGTELSQLNSRMLVFQFTTSAANTVSNLSCIDNAALNDNPSAQIVVTHLFNKPGELGGVYLNKAIGVYFQSIPGTWTSNKWCIYTEDSSAMPEDLTFNVIAFGQPVVL